MDLTPIPRGDVVRHHAGDPAINSLHPQIVTLTDGRVLMGFEGRTVEGGQTIGRYYGQFLDADSQPVGAPLALGDLVAGRANRFDLAALEDGGFAIAWGPRENVFEHFVRSFDETGAPRGAPVRVETPVPGANSGWLSLDALPDGGFAVAWTGQWPAASWFGAPTRTAIFHQRFEADGTAQGPAVQVADFLEMTQMNMGGRVGTPAVTALEGGESVVVWASQQNQGEDAHRGLFGRRIDDDGAPVGEVFRVADFGEERYLTENGHQLLPLPGGGFAVLWNQPVAIDGATPGGTPVGGTGLAVMLQRFDAGDAPQGDMQRLSQPDQPNASEGQAVVLPDGTVALVWHTRAAGVNFGGDDAGWFQRLDAGFGPLAPPVRIEVGEPIGDRAAFATLRVAADADGAPFLAWHFGGTQGFTVLSQSLFPQVIGTPGADVLTAGAAATVIHGLDGNDTLLGGEGDDTLVGGRGDDLLDGGGGRNTAVFTGNRDDYVVTRDGDTVIVTDTRAGTVNEGSDTLTRVQVLRFADGETDLDLPLAVPVSGSVLGRAGEPLSPVTVAFTPEDGAPVSVVADADGGFRLDLAPGVPGLLELSRDHGPEDPGITTASALEALRLAVGLPPSWGTATAMDFLAADFDGDGRVTTADALDILRVAVGLGAGHQPRWIFVEEDADLSGIGRLNTSVETGLALDPLDAALDGLAFTGILVGHVQPYV